MRYERVYQITDSISGDRQDECVDGWATAGVGSAVRGSTTGGRLSAIIRRATIYRRRMLATNLRMKLTAARGKRIE
jgi:hypothetical protein